MRLGREREGTAGREQQPDGPESRGKLVRGGWMPLLLMAVGALSLSPPNAHVVRRLSQPSRGCSAGSRSEGMTAPRRQKGLVGGGGVLVKGFWQLTSACAGVGGGRWPRATTVSGRYPATFQRALGRFKQSTCADCSAWPCNMMNESPLLFERKVIRATA